MALALLLQIFLRIGDASVVLQAPPDAPLAYTECVSVPIGTYSSHLYCAEGEVLFTLGGAVAFHDGLLGCSEDVLDVFSRRLNCLKLAVTFRFQEKFLTGGL